MSVSETQVQQNDEQAIRQLVDETGGQRRPAEFTL